MDIVTLTVNPALDKNSSVDRVVPDSKLRCDEPRYEPGGGGINVSRAIHKLGGKSFAYYLGGGPAGELMHTLLKEEGVAHEMIPSSKWTRENLTVMETSTKRQYRFGMPGPEIPENEWQQCLKVLEKCNAKYIVASGSLPPGVPKDFYARLARIAREKGIRLVVDTSGEALMTAAEEGVYMLKPNLRELGHLAGKDSISAMEQEELAQKVVRNGKCKVVVVSLGARGAMLATRDVIEYVVPPTVKPDSTVGAGDSMVAGIVLSLVTGRTIQDAVRYGVAAGTAATMTPGTELCRKEDTEEIYEWLKARS